MPHTSPRVTGLFIYPVKSCSGIQLTGAELDDFGFRQDRRWMVVDPAGRFLTQRELPRMALIETALDEGRVVLRAAGMEPLALAPPARTDGSVAVRVWNDQVAALDGGDEAARWLTDLLETPCRIVYMPKETNRTGPGLPAGSRVSFADSCPFLLISQESLDALNARLNTPVEMIRFRPNIVVSGVEPHGEDRWQRIRANDVEFLVIKRCSRCAIPTVDPKTGTKGKEPIRTLARYRTVDRKVYFGVKLAHLGRGHVRVGDRVRVLTPASTTR